MSSPPRANPPATPSPLSGLLEPSSGRVFLGGVDVTRLPTYRRCHLGLGRAFQVVQPFPEMTVEENLMVGALFGKPGASAADAARRVEGALERTRSEERRVGKECMSRWCACEK